MTTTVDDDFREFVAARWPELESVALIVVLDAERARALTADALAGMSRRWQESVDAGRPGEQARRAVLRRAVTAAPGTKPQPQPQPGADSPNRSHLPHPQPGADVTYWSNVSQGEPDEDPVVAALVDAIRAASPIERAVLGARELWGCEPDEVAHLLDLDRGSVREHAASVEHRLGAAHDAARAADGLEPSPWSRERDVSAAVEQILHGVSDPPDPAALVTHRRTGIRRRTLLTAGAAALALTGAGAALVRRGTSDPASKSATGATGAARLAPDDPRWASAAQWTPRGPLADDPAVIALATRSGDVRNRLLWAGDIGTQRVVLILSYTAPGDGQGDGGEFTSDLDITYSEPFVTVRQGPRGMDPARLTLKTLVTSGNVASGADGDVVAITLPPDPEGPPQAFLIVLTRPSVQSASVSHYLRPRRDGTIERDWSPLPLVDGVSATILDTDLPLATRVRVGPSEVPPESFTVIQTAVSDGPPPSTSPEWAERCVTALTGVPAGDLTSTVFVDAEVPRGLFEWPPPPDAVPARLVSLLTTTPNGAVFRTTAYTGDGFAWALEPTSLFTPETARDPIVVWASDERVGVARFLVAAPGADRVQLISTSPDGYPVSKVVATRGRDAVVVPVVNGADAGEYRIIAKDADGRVVFDGVPSPGSYAGDR